MTWLPWILDFIWAPPKSLNYMGGSYQWHEFHRYFHYQFLNIRVPGLLRIGFDAELIWQNNYLLYHIFYFQYVLENFNLLRYIFLKNFLNSDVVLFTSSEWIINCKIGAMLRLCKWEGQNGGPINQNQKG